MPSSVTIPPGPSHNHTLAFLAAASALTWAGVFLALVGRTGPLALAVEDTLRASSSTRPWSLVTLRARFILSAFGVPTKKKGGTQWLTVLLALQNDNNKIENDSHSIVQS
jgi:hypothetical protein